MYDNSNVQWFNQTLLSHKDKVYATEGYLRLSLTSSTEDYKYFSPPSLNLSISNNYQKAISLNIQNAKDLVRAFKNVLSQLNGHELNIQRKYQKDTVLHFTFKLDSNNKRIVVIEIRNNETDFTKTIIPLEGVFEALATCIREFTEQYMSICSQLFIQSVNSQSVQIIQQLPSLIKCISSQIVTQIPAEVEILDSRAPEIEPEKVCETQATIEDLDKFLGDNMQNVNIPEFEKVEKESVTEVDSLFTKYFIDNDLQNLENAMANYFTMASPFMELIKDLKNKIGNHITDEDFNILPGISEDDMKSIVYLSKLFSSLTYNRYLVFGEAMPASTPVFKFDPKEYKEINLEIAYDLFLYNMYVRIMRRRLENKIEDAINSKAFFNIQLRCFTDPIVFSFIDKVDKTKLSSIVLNRYKYYESIGVFDYYKGLLSENKCPEITENDILSVVNEAIEKVVGISPYANTLHNSMEKPNSLRITSKNTLNLEQIINEVVPLEIAEKTGKDIKNDEIIKELRQVHNISDEILDMFRGKEKKMPEPKKVEKTSNLERLIRSQFMDEVPDKYKESFFSYILELGTKKFDLENSPFPIDEFGDNIIKALYLWDPENDPVIGKNYKQFFLKVEQELMERDLILSKIKSTPPESDGGWGFLTE